MSRSHRRRLVALIALMLAGLVAWVWQSHRQPSFEGRTLGEWCDLGIASVADDNESSALLASNAVWQIGDRAVPWLVDWATVGQPQWESWLDEKADSRFKTLDNWIYGRDKARDRDRERAGFLADTLRERAGPAIPELINPKWFKDLDVFIASQETIYRIGAGGIPYLAFALTNASSEYRSNARHLLDGWGSEAESAGAMIWPQLDPNDESEEQDELLATLAAIRHRPAETVAAIRSRIQRYPDKKGLWSIFYGALWNAGPHGMEEFALGLAATNSFQRSAAIETLFDRSSLLSEEPSPSLNLDKSTRSLLAQTSSTGKLNLLLFAKELLSGNPSTFTRQRRRALISTFFLDELANDADSTVSTMAKGLKNEFKTMLDTHRNHAASKRGLLKLRALSY